MNRLNYHQSEYLMHAAEREGQFILTRSLQHAAWSTQQHAATDENRELRKFKLFIEKTKIFDHAQAWSVFILPWKYELK